MSDEKLIYFWQSFAFQRYVLVGITLLVVYHFFGCSPARTSSPIEAKEIPTNNAEYICFAFYQDGYRVEAFAANCVKR